MFYFFLIIILILVVFIFFKFGRNQTPDFETAIVEKGSVSRVVSETGLIETTKEVDLAFTVPGRLVSLLVDRGSKVVLGQEIARLDSSQALANLQQAQAALRAAEARLDSNSGVSSQTKQQQDQLVSSAKSALISGDLQAYLISDTYGEEWSSSQPVVTGNYSCDKEGEYFLKLYSSSAASGYSFSLSGLERGVGNVSSIKPEPIGNCGLFVQFPENFLRGGDVVWSIPVPNVRSATYLTRLNAYKSALEARDLALISASSDQVLLADIDQAKAAVSIAQTNLNQTRLTSPFSGVITKVHHIPGATISAGLPVVSLLSDERFEIKIKVPEDDIDGIEIGDKAEVSFDAFENLFLEAEVIYISPNALDVAGAVSFEVILRLVEVDDRVRSGLTVDVDIFADAREDVLVVPVRSVIEKDRQRFVRVMEDDISYRLKAITVGLRGGGFYEVLSGLTGGERIITFVNEAALSQLTELTD